MTPQTHNWGKTAKFFQELGFTIEFGTDHGSGMLRCGEGPYVFPEELPEDRPLQQLQVLIRVDDAETCRPGPPVEVVVPFEDTHWGTQEMLVRDPDSRLWSLQAPPKAPT